MDDETLKEGKRLLHEATDGFFPDVRLPVNGGPYEKYGDEGYLIGADGDHLIAYDYTEEIGCYMEPPAARLVAWLLNHASELLDEPLGEGLNRNEGP